MFKTSMPSSQTSGFLKTLNYNTWNRIIGDIVAVTSLVLQDHGTRQVIDQVPPPQALRLTAQPESPLEAGPLHPERRAPHTYRTGEWRYTVPKHQK